MFKLRRGGAEKGLVVEVDVERTRNHTVKHGAGALAEGRQAPKVLRRVGRKAAVAPVEPGGWVWFEKAKKRRLEGGRWRVGRVHPAPLGRRRIALGCVGRA